MSSVLYDTPGPKAVRRYRLGGVLGLVVLLALAALVVWRLASRGQFAWELWAPLLDPRNEAFQQVWTLLRQGFTNTLMAAVLAIVLSLTIGVILGILRLTLPGWIRWLVVALIEGLRGTPVVLMIFFVYVVLPQFGIRLDNLWYLVIALTAYNSVIVAEILRAGVAALPRGQREAGLAIGLTPVSTLWLIQLPQAFRIMLPALVSQMVVALKDTTLAAVALAGFVEALNQGKVIYLILDNPIQVYTVIGVIFVTVNYALSKFAGWLEARLAGRTGGRRMKMRPIPEIPQSTNPPPAAK